MPTVLLGHDPLALLAKDPEATKITANDLGQNYYPGRANRDALNREAVNGTGGSLARIPPPLEEQVPRLEKVAQKQGLE